jgi:sterol desaturase/sphingolipid hydroxylase (fatty acid hydroxylase superfamily)
MNAIPSIINLGVGSVVVGFTTLTIFAIGLAIERTAPAEQCQPVDAIRLNVIYGLFHGFIRSAVGTMLAGISLFSIIAVGGGWITLPSEGWKVGFSAIVYLLTTDFAEYLFHRAQHAVPFLWALHSLHHSDRAVNVTTTARHHWIEFLIKAIVIYPLVGLLFAVPYQVLLVTSIAGYYNFFLHFNIRISFGCWWPVLNSPQYHRVHHSDRQRHRDRNFAALFPIFDVLFRTFHRPIADEYPTTGLTGREGPSAAWEAIVWPFWRGGVR